MKYLIFRTCSTGIVMGLVTSPIRPQARFEKFPKKFLYNCEVEMAESDAVKASPSVTSDSGTSLSEQSDQALVQNVPDLSEFQDTYGDQSFDLTSSSLADILGFSSSSSIRKKMKLIQDALPGIPESFFYQGTSTTRTYSSLSKDLLQSLKDRPSGWSESGWVKELQAAYPALAVSKPQASTTETHSVQSSEGEPCVAIAHVTPVTIEAHDYGQASESLFSISQRYSASPSHLNGGALVLTQTILSLDVAIQTEQARLEEEAAALDARKQLIFEAQDALPGMANAVEKLRAQSAQNEQSAEKIAAAEVALGKQLEEIQTGPERELPS